MRSDYHLSTHELRFSPFEVKYITIGPSRLSTMRNMLGQFGPEVLENHLVGRAVVSLHSGLGLGWRFIAYLIFLASAGM